MAKKTSALPVHHESTLPPQQILDLFKVVFHDELYEQDAEALHRTIQTVKTDLYNRDYAAAFDNEDKRSAYCCRWSPPRAVAYASLFGYLKEVREIIQCKSSAIDDKLASLSLDESPRNGRPNIDSNILCIGGGAGGELVSIASIFTPSRDFSLKYSKTPQKDDTSPKLNVHLVDIANWSHLVGSLDKGISENWLYDQSKNFNVTFEHKDILGMTPRDLKLKNLNLITLLFTTNELFTEQKAASIRFFQNLNANCMTGCHLLIVESAGSFSHITVGTKKFPIQFLVDTLLLGKRGEERKGDWEIVDQSDSLWYRGNDEFDYPVKLENMRFFYRLYRKK